VAAPHYRAMRAGRHSGTRAVRASVDLSQLSRDNPSLARRFGQSAPARRRGRRGRSKRRHGQPRRGQRRRGLGRTANDAGPGGAADGAGPGGPANAVNAPATRASVDLSRLSRDNPSLARRFGQSTPARRRGRRGCSRPGRVANEGAASGGVDNDAGPGGAANDAGPDDSRNPTPSNPGQIKNLQESRGGSLVPCGKVRARSGACPRSRRAATPVPWRHVDQCDRGAPRVQRTR
jgi:hypothetical protein